MPTETRLKGSANYLDSQQISKIYTPGAEVPLVSIVSLDEIKDPSLPSTLSTKLRSSSLWSTFPKRPIPSLWRDAGHKLRLAYYQLALDSQGPSFKFDVRLSEELMAEGRRTSQGFTDLVRRRAALHLNGDSAGPSTLVRVETKVNATHPHLHGAVAISESKSGSSQAGSSRCVNTKGKFRKVRRQDQTGHLWLGVAGYARKSLSETTLGFPGQNVTATHRVKRVAEDFRTRPGMDHKHEVPTDLLIEVAAADIVLGRAIQARLGRELINHRLRQYRDFRLGW